jgi:hypothetical protein
MDTIIVRSKAFALAGLVFGLAFAVLMMIRLDVFEHFFSRPRTYAHSAAQSLTDRETWMSIFQGDRKIGFSHSRFFAEGNAYRLKETVSMRINTMGIIQDLRLTTHARLQPDLTVESFDFEISSGRFRHRIEGNAADSVLTVHGGGTGRKTSELKLMKPTYLAATVVDAMAGTDLTVGDRLIFNVFDPATMAQAPLNVEVLEWETIPVAGEKMPAAKLALHFKGSTQLAWISLSGDLLRQKGLLGLRLEKSRREDALKALDPKGSRDLTLAASVAVSRRLPSPERLEEIKLRITGGSLQGMHLHGGRQVLQKDVLTIRKESLDHLAKRLDPERLGRLEAIFTRPDALIQSDHEKIKTLARKILHKAPGATPLQKVRRFMEWIEDHIEQRPVLSLPDALSTLENRMGDCNEHAVLMAALARASGIPARVEAGLVYLNHRFYYHAWNLLYLGRWITVDALYGQVPADVTHIRFVTGSPQQQLDLIGAIGNIRLEILESRPPA